MIRQQVRIAPSGLVPGGYLFVWQGDGGRGELVLGRNFGAMTAFQVSIKQLSTRLAIAMLVFSKGL